LQQLEEEQQVQQGEGVLQIHKEEEAGEEVHQVSKKEEAGRSTRSAARKDLLKLVQVELHKKLKMQLRGGSRRGYATSPDSAYYM
jgi:hypothetical protein